MIEDIEKEQSDETPEETGEEARVGASDETAAAEDEAEAADSAMAESTDKADDEAAAETSTEAPGTEAPGTEAPGTEAPGTEAPGTEAPGTEAPGTEAPGTEAPGTEASGTEAPGTEAPGTEAPGTEAPGTESPGTEAPGTEAPGTEAPGTEAPGTEAPGTEAPGTEAPGTEAPGEEATERTPEEEAAELKDRLLRALADVENTRRRAGRDLDEMRRYGASNFAKDLLNVCDNLGRALASAPDDLETRDESFQTLVAGVELVEKELLAAFEKHGIKKIDSVGEMFNHDFHQAMYEVEDTGRPAGTVVEVLQPGYVMHDRLLRPAMVAVAKGESDEPPEGMEPIDTTA